MPEEYVDRAYLDIDGTTIECIECNPHDSIELSPVKPMTRQNRPTGWTSDIPEYEISATVPLRKDGMLIPWRKYMREKTEFTTTIEYEGGQAVTYLRCRVADIDVTSEQGSRTDVKVMIKGLYAGDN